MIGLDTNILLRLILKDDAKQHARILNLLTKKLTARRPGFINLVVLMELAWTLRRAFKQSNESVLTIVERLLGMDNIVVERSEIVARALWLSLEKHIDLPDALISRLNEAEGCTETLTLDEDFARSGAAALVT
ncbi:MAG: PIN domain-containing protein [Hyphomicrobiales bacterium]